MGGKFAGQELWLKTGQLLPILLLVLVGVGLYLLWHSQDRRLQAIEHQLAQQETVQRQRLELVLRVLETHDYNASHPPEQHLPLLVTPAPTP